MTIARNDLKFKKSATVTDTGINGGRMSYIDILNRTKYNLFPRVTKPERTIGLTRYRKEFVWNAESNNEIAFGVLAYPILPSLADDRFHIALGTQSDTQSDIDSTYEWHGTGFLNADVIAGDLVVAINFESTDVDLTNGTLLAINSFLRLNEDITSTVQPLNQVYYNGAMWIAQTAPTPEDEDVYPYGTCVELLGGDKANIFSYSGDGHLEYHRVAAAEYTENMAPAPDGIEVAFSLTCANLEVEESSVHIQYTIASTLYHAYDDGAGNITGTLINIGSINYVSGLINITFSSAPDNASTISATYQESAVVWVGNTATVTLADSLLNNFVSTNTTIGMCLELEDLTPTKEKDSENLNAGSFDESKIDLTNLGSVEDTWTLAFTTNVNYTVVGSIVGSVGAGNVTGAFTPINPDQGAAYFSITTDCWIGVTAVAGDTVVFKTHPSSKPVWWREVVPALTVAYSNNLTMLEIYVE